MPLAIPVFAGLLALMCILGVDVLNKAIGGLLASIPIIGGALARTVQFDAQLVGWLWGHVQPIAQAIVTPHVNHATEQGLNVVAHQANLDAIAKLHRITVPQAAAGATQSAINALDPKLEWVGLEALDWQTYKPGLQANLSRLNTSVTQTLPQAIASIEPATIRAVQAFGYVTATDLAGTRAGIERDIGTAAAGAQAGAVKQLTPVIGQVQTQVGSIAQEVTGVLAPGLAGVLTLTQSLVGRIGQVEECTAGICSSGSGNVLGDLGKLLQNIGQFATDAAVFALIAEAIRDPHGLADAVTSAFAPVVEVAEAAIRDATGVAA